MWGLCIIDTCEDTFADCSEVDEIASVPKLRVGDAPFSQIVMPTSLKSIDSAADTKTVEAAEAVSVTVTSSGHAIGSPELVIQTPSEEKAEVIEWASSTTRLYDTVAAVLISRISFDKL